MGAFAKIKSSALAFALAWTFFVCDTHAQSHRASRAPRLERLPERVIKARQEWLNRDIDIYFGRVARIDGKEIIVRLAPSPVPPQDRIPLFYVADKKLRPVALLKDLNISHKTSAAFLVEEGSALVGDIVMVKYIKPKD